MKVKPGQTLILVFAVLLVVGAFVTDVFLLPEVTLPGPPFFLSILIAAYFLSPRDTAGVAVLATALKLAADLAQGTPAWLTILYFVAMVLVSLAGTALAGKIKSESTLSEERKHLLEEIDERGRPFEAVVENAPVGISVLRGPSFRYELVNPAYQAIVPGKALLGRTVAETWPELADQVVPLLQQVLETGKSFSATDGLFPVQRTAGGPVEDVYFTFSYVLMGRPEARADTILVLVMETTEQVRARQRIEELAAVAESRASELETIVESIADAVFVCDSQGKITLVNRTGLALVGEEKTEDLGTLTGYMDRLKPRGVDGRPVSLNDLAISRALLGEVTRGREETGFHPVTRRNISLQVSAAPLKNGMGRVIGAVEVATDVTRLKELTEEAQRHAADLASANKELEAFSYSVAHDLRSPVRHMYGFSKALLLEYADKLDERGKKYLQFVQEGSGKMGQLIDDLLALTGVSRNELRYADVDLSELARSAAMSLQQHHPERQVDFVIAPCVVAKGDPRLLGLVIENLLANAWKFTARREHARIEFGVTHEQGTTVYYFRDNGVGFDKAYAHKLFRAFERLHSEVDFPGSGIGLATVERVVRRHGGRVWAEGEVDKTATFYFTLGSSLSEPRMNPD